MLSAMVSKICNPPDLQAVPSHDMTRDQRRVLAAIEGPTTARKNAPEGDQFHDGATRPLVTEILGYPSDRGDELPTS